MTDLDVRMATAITEMVASNRNLHEMLVNRLDVRDRVEALERDVAVLEARTA
jgi:hypothetical protein